MRDLSTLRQGWDEIEAEETRLLRELTIQESMSQLLRLQQAVEPQLQQTEALFRADRIAYLGGASTSFTTARRMAGGTIPE